MRTKLLGLLAATIIPAIAVTATIGRNVPDMFRKDATKMVSYSKGGPTPLLNNSPASQDKPFTTASPLLQAPTAYTATANRNIVIYGQLCSDYNWPSADAGIYSYSVADNTFTPLLTDHDGNIFNANGGVYAEDGYYYAISDNAISKYDLNNLSAGAISTVPTTTKIGSIDITYDVETKKVYGIIKQAGAGYYDPDSYYLATIDLATGTVSKLGDNLPGTGYGIAADAKGNVYAIVTNPNVSYYYPCLHKVNKSTGALSPVGNPISGLDWGSHSSSVFDFKSGQLYCTAGGWYTYLYNIDISSGTPTKIAEFPNGEQFCSLVIPYTITPASAPALLTDLDVTFTDANGNATVSFTVPTTTYDGSPLSGSVNYAITLDEESLATGSSQTGEHVAKNINIKTRGNITITVTLTGADGKASINDIETYSGTDTPAPPVAVTASAKDNDLSISWTAPQKGVNGGYINTSALTYKIVLQPMGTEIASAATGTSFNYTLDFTEPRSIYAEVTATDGSLSGEAAASQRINAGPAYQVPYSENFADKEHVYLYTIEDSNADDISWEYYSAINENYMNCNYSTEKAKDDWLFTPAVHLEKGMQYTLSFSASARKISFPELLEVKLGKQPVSTAMETTILEKEKVNNAVSYTWFEYSIPLTVEESADYYIGYHAISDADMDRLAIDNIVIDGAHLGAPAQVVDIETAPAPWGVYSATVKFRTPVTKVDGSELASITKAEIYLNKRLYKTIDNPTPGSDQTLLIDETIDGMNDIDIYCYNEAGRSVSGHATVYTGADSPASPANFKALPTSSGIKLTWDVPAGANNGYVNPDDITYYIGRYINGEFNIVADNIPSTTCTDTYDGDTQTSIIYALIATNEIGNSPTTMSNIVVTGGTPYALPFKESFTDGFVSIGMLWENQSLSSGRGLWTLWNPKSYGNITPQDNDNGAIVFSPDKVGDVIRIYSGNIDLSPSKHPVLEFWYRGDNSTCSLAVQANGAGEGWDDLIKIALSSSNNQWKQIKLPLDRYNYLNNVQISFVGTANTDLSNIFIDNIVIRDVFADDLSVKLSTRKNFYPYEPQTLTATITNEGENPADSYTVEIYRDDNLIKSAEMTNLGVDAVETVKVDDVITLDAADTAVYTARVIYNADKNTSNNEAAVEVRNHLPAYPAPTNLTVSGDENAYDFAWEAPAPYVAPEFEPVTDDFESYEPFIIDEIGDWTVIDENGQDGTFGLLGISYPYYGKAKSWQVFNLWALGIEMGDDEVTWRPNSGHQFLVAFCDADRQNDDWLISPVLSGEAQTISFYARSLNEFTYGPEAYEVLASSTSKETGDFVTVNKGTVPGEWTRFDIDLPAGTRYFAIKCVSKDVWAMGLDDITYIPGDGIVDGLELLGYNFYQNNVPVNNAILATTVNSWAGKATDTYAVTAVYNQGESRMSNKVIPAQSGINSITGNDNVTVTTRDNNIIIDNADGKRVAVYSTDGIKIAACTGTPHTVIPATSGIYIVTVANNPFKVIVK